jgi:multisubunit Na+/H+ antiporter MnhC subunit
MTWARLAFRLQPSTIAFAALVCLGLAGAAAWLTMNMRSMLAQCETSGAADDCGVIHVFGSPIGEPAMLTQMVIGLAMYAVPLVLGVPVVTREIEQRTAMIAWSLAGSRLRWLAWRAGSVLVIGMVPIGVLAFAAEGLAGVHAPGSDLGFLQHGARGISLMTRAGLMLVVAVALGAAIGRLLPSLMIGIALAVGLSTAVESLPPYGVAPTELMLSGSNFEGGHPLQTGHGYRAPDGTPISDDEAEAMLMAIYEEYSPQLPPASVLPQDVYYGIAGSRYFEVLARESAVLIGATVLVGGLAAAVVQRRRP